MHKSAHVAHFHDSVTLIISFVAQTVILCGYSIKFKYHLVLLNNAS